ncbi:MAG TPA: hypothetical protein VLL96_06900 [Candidatus Deferrimicrobiaceae bacterium]|nr:hypothetical protein [Candidatus Deferrimicrobiaceae bacterium]
MTKTTKPQKQFTLDNFPDAHPKDALEIIKEQQDEPITITQIEPTTKEDELNIKIAFKLPAKKAFSRVKSDLWFDRELAGSVVVRMLQGPLAMDESEFSAILDMRGIAAGQHIIGVEMFGLWGNNEKLCRTIQEITVDYVPQTRQSRLVRSPIVRSVVGADLGVISETEKGIYKNIEKTVKMEHSSKRDNW